MICKLALFLIFASIFFIGVTSVEAEEPKSAPGEIIVKFKDGQAPPDVRRDAYQRAQNRKSFFGRIRNSAEDAINSVRGESAPEVKLQQLNEVTQEAKVITEEKISREEKGNLNNLYVIKTKGKSLSELEKLYKSLPGIEYVEPNFIAKTQSIPNDPMYNQMWSLSKIQAEKAWDITKGDKNVKVAVVDTGIDYTHKELGETSLEERPFDKITQSGENDDPDRIIDSDNIISIDNNRIAYGFKDNIIIHHLDTNVHDVLNTLPPGNIMKRIVLKDNIIFYTAYDSQTGEAAFYVYNLTTQENKKIANSRLFGTMGISNGKAVYERTINFSEEFDFEPGIYMYDIATGIETQIASGFDKFDPKVSGNSIIYLISSEVSPFEKLKVYDMTTRQTRDIFPPNLGPVLDFQGSKILYGSFDLLNFDSTWSTYYLYDINTNQYKTLKFPNAEQNSSQVNPNWFVEISWIQKGSIENNVVYFSKNINGNRIIAYDMNLDRYVQINNFKNSGTIDSEGNKICFVASDKDVYCHNYDPNYSYPPVGNVFNNRVVGGYNFVSNDENPYDDFGHGTHIAGTIGAITNNGIGVSGINWDVSLMAVKVLDANGSGSWDNVIQGIQFAVDNGAKVINMSLGGPFSCDQAMQDAIDYATSRGVTVVAAAGNDSVDAANFSPASCNGVIAVGATRPTDVRASYSNYGSTVDIAAPGGDSSSCSTSAQEDCLINSTFPDNQYELLEGTSMATPHVAGAVALLLAYRPSLTPLDIETALKVSGDYITTDQPIGTRLNIFKVLQNLGPPPTTSPSLSPRAIGYAISESLSDINNISTPSATVDNFPITFNYTFQEAVAGIKVLFAKFFYSDGTSVISQSSLNYQPLISPSPSAQPSASASATPTILPTPTESPTVSPTPTASASASPTTLPSPTASSSAAPSPSPTDSPSPTPTQTPIGTPAPTPPPTTDIDGDGTIGIFDYNILVSNFGQTGPDIPADIDQDGDVDIFDYNTIVTFFGQSL